MTVQARNGCMQATTAIYVMTVNILGEAGVMLFRICSYNFTCRDDGCPY